MVGLFAESLTLVTGQGARRAVLYEELLLCHRI